MKAIFTLILCLIVQRGYSQAPLNIKEKQRAIGKLIYVKPDSAKVLIKQILNYKGTLPDTTYAVANTYYGYYQLLKNNPDSSIYYYNRAISYSGNSPAHHARVLRNMGAAYRRKADYEQSMKVLSRAEEKYLALNDGTGLATVYGEMASNYNVMLKSHEAIPYLKKAIVLLEKEKNTVNLIPIKQSLANTYLNIGNYEFAAELYEEVLKSFKSNGMLKNYYLTLINYSDCLISLNRPEAAKRTLLESISGLEKFNDTELIGSAYGTLGRLEVNRGNFIQGEIYQEKAFFLLASVNSGRTVGIGDFYLRSLSYLDKIDRALEVISIIDKGPFKGKANLQDLSRFEKTKIGIYNKIENSDLALASAKNAIELLDTLNKTQDKKAVLEMQAGIQRDYQSKKEDKLASTNVELRETVDVTERKKWFWIYIPFVMLAALLSYYLYNISRHKKRVAENQSAIRNLSAEQQSARMLNEKMYASIEEKQQKLSNIELKTGRIEDYLNTVKSQSHVEVVDVTKQGVNPVMEELKSLISSDNYGDQFRETFTNANAAFIESLGKDYPHLSESDLYFCALLNLNLPYKDLAIILKVVPEAVRKRKYRIRKKMGITDEKELERLLLTHSKALKY